MAGQDMRWKHADRRYPPEIDISKPSVARVYDAVLGGKDNFAADRAVAAEAQEAFPDGGKAAHVNRALLGRAVRHMAGQGVTQFIDLGSGLPTVRNTHEIAQAVSPDARVVYVDNDRCKSGCAHVRTAGQQTKPPRSAASAGHWAREAA
jgi:hypothetical protein